MLAIMKITDATTVPSGFAGYGSDDIVPTGAVVRRAPWFWSDVLLPADRAGQDLIAQNLVDPDHVRIGRRVPCVESA
jgi:hypothetical protein